jgi:hypothetical protein
MAFCAEIRTCSIVKTPVRNLMLGLAAVLMLGHSLVPHDHSTTNPPQSLLWQLFSVDLGGDHLQHYAPTHCESAPEDANHQQLHLLPEFEALSFGSSEFSTPKLQTKAAEARALGHLTSWSRRPPPSKFS